MMSDRNRWSICAIVFMTVGASGTALAQGRAERPDRGVGHDGGGYSRQETHPKRAVLTGKDKELIRALATKENVSATKIETEARKNNGDVAVGLKAAIKAEKNSEMSLDDAKAKVSAVKATMK